jgi:hypothetical protein
MVAALVVIMAVFVLGLAIIRQAWPVQGVNLGDAYEGLAALFSGLAFIGVIYALAYQRAELRLQREELTLTREEMVNQRHEMEAQNLTLAHQRFENSFFQLLRFHRESMQAMRTISYAPIGVFSSAGSPLEDEVLEGSRAFRWAVGYLESYFARDGGQPRVEEERLKYIDDYFKPLCFSGLSDFGHYFRTLYHLIEFVDKDTSVDRVYYVGLVRAQLSTDELALLFYNGLTEQGQGFKSFIEQYALFKNWRIHKAFQGDRVFYQPEAYGE